MSKYNWEENFRRDGTRGACPEKTCGQHFNIRNGQTLKTAMLQHYSEYHKDKLLKAITYVDKIYAEAKAEVDNKPRYRIEDMHT